MLREVGASPVPPTYPPTQMAHALPKYFAGPLPAASGQ